MRVCEHEMITFWNERTDHLLGRDLPISLDVPKAQGTNRRRDGLRQSEIRALQEAKLEFVVLTDIYQQAGCIQTLPIAENGFGCERENEKRNIHRPARRKQISI